MTSETFERELLLRNYITFRRAMRIFFEREKLHQEEIKNDLGRCEIISIQKALNKMMIEQKESEILMSFSRDTVNSIDRRVQFLSEQVCEGLVGKGEGLVNLVNEKGNHLSVTFLF